MDRRAMACCRHSLRRLMGSPRIWALLILCVLCFDRYIAPIRALLRCLDKQVHTASSSEGTRGEAR